MNELDILRPFDTAPAEIYDDVAATRARARFEQIVSVSPERVPELVDVPRPRARRHTVVLRWAAIPAAAAVAIGVGVALPGGVGTAPAFASWSQSPATLTDASLDQADDVCSATLDEAVATAGDPGDGPDLTLTTPVVELAERRGDWSLLTYRGAAGETAVCLTLDRGGAPAVAHWYLSSSGGSTTASGAAAGGSDLGDDVVTSAWGSAHSTTATAASDEVAFQSASGAVMVGEGPFTVIQGVIGADVAAVVVHAGGHDVETTVKDGHFIAWWPDGDMPDGVWHDGTLLTVTLTDGTVRDGVSFANL